MPKKLKTYNELKTLLSFIKSQFPRLIPLFFIDWLVPKNRNIFLYGAFAGNLYGENSRFLFEYAVKNEPQIKHYWVTADKTTFLELKSQFPNNVLYAKSLKGFLTILRAKVIIVSDQTTDVYYFLTKRHLIINLYHGIPLKRIGKVSTAKRPLAFSAAKLLANRYDFCLASSEIERIIV